MKERIEEFRHYLSTVFLGWSVRVCPLSGERMLLCRFLEGWLCCLEKFRREPERYNGGEILILALPRQVDSHHIANVVDTMIEQQTKADTNGQVH